VPKTSAGILLYRERDGAREVLLVHPGGPFWARKDAGAWSIPKGELEPGEDPLSAARREFEEETGIRPDGDFVPLGTVTHKGGKVVHAWAFLGDCDPSSIKSNTFTIEWPPRSGRIQSFPEIDRAAWFDTDTARRKLVRGQVEFVDRLLARQADKVAEGVVVGKSTSTSSKQQGAAE